MPKLFLIFLTFLALLFQSCRKDIKATKNELTIDASEYDYTLKNPSNLAYNLLGQLHNEGMDSCFEAIKTEALDAQKHTNNNISSTTMNSAIQNGMTKFFKTNKHLKLHYEKHKLRLLPVSSIMSSKSNTTKASNVEELSKHQNDLLKQIKAVIPRNFDPSKMQYLKNELEKINSTAGKILTESEASVIYMATSITFSSYQYWNKNYRKWYIAINYPDVVREFKNKDLNTLYFKNKKKDQSFRTMDETYYGGMLEEVVIYGQTQNTASYWDAVTTWWDNHHQQIITDDLQGGVEGFVAGAYSGWNGGVWFGPQGAIVASASGALVGSAWGAVGGSAWGYYWAN